MDFKNDVGKKVVQILIDSLIYLKKKINLQATNFTQK
jgi:hypothetical protein